MKLFLQLLPTLLIAAIALVFSFRMIALARRLRREGEAEHQRRMAAMKKDHEVRMAALDAPPPEPGLLRVSIDLGDPDMVADIAAVARETEPFLAELSGYEVALGGKGLILTHASAEAGRVVLTLTPKDATGAAGRVKRVADALNAAFDPDDTPGGEPAPELRSLRLPDRVAGVWASTALAA